MSQPTLHRYWYGGSTGVYEETNYTTVCNFTDPTFTYLPIINFTMDTRNTKEGQLFFFLNETCPPGTGLGGGPRSWGCNRWVRGQ